MSQYTFPKKNTNEIFLNNKNINISHNNFYKDDISVLKKLIIFSQNKNIKLYIKLRNPNSEKEILFYKNNLKTKKINFLSSKNLNDNYQLIDKAKLVVFLDSYFGYEAFARGKKIAAFSIRGKKLKLKNANFADNRLPNKGFFWSNQCTQSDLNKLIERVLTISEKGWFRIKRKYENKIMFYNSNNNIFKKKIKKMLNS